MQVPEHLIRAIEKQTEPYLEAAKRGDITSEELYLVYERKYQELVELVEKDFEQRAVEKVLLCPNCFAPKGSKNCCQQKALPMLDCESPEDKMSRRRFKDRRFNAIFRGIVTDPVPRLIRAIVEARKIVVREHVKADRIERVGHFITCIRREFGRSEMSQVLSDKKIWYDIGRVLPGCSIPYNNCGVNMTSLNDWVRQAEKALPKAELEMVNSMAALDGCVIGAGLGLSDARRINEEAVEVLSSLKKVLQEI